MPHTDRYPTERVLRPAKVELFRLLIAAVTLLLMLLGVRSAAIAGNEGGPALESGSRDWPQMRLSWSRDSWVDTLTISASESATCYVHIIPAPSLHNEFTLWHAIIAFSRGIELQGFSPILAGDVHYTPPERIEVGASSDTFAVDYHDCPVLGSTTLLARIDLYLDITEMGSPPGPPTPYVLPVPISPFPRIGLNWDELAGCSVVIVALPCAYNGIYVRAKAVPSSMTSWGGVKALYR